VSHPAELPDLFIDRSLGRVQVPTLLRAAELRLVTLAEHYGIPADQKVRDAEWLQLVGERGWVALMKDSKVRFNRAEQEAVKRYAVRCFCIPRQDLTARQMADRFLHNMSAMEAACREPGPFMYAVDERRLRPLPLR
jgi:PIN like domain